MTLKSILSIDVDDSSFRRYQESFQKYQDLLSKTPEAWARVTKEVDASRKSFDTLVAAAAARQGYAKLTAEAERTAARLTEEQSRSWGDMARHTKTVAGNIDTATKSLLQWVKVGAFVTGLLGGGGLYGIDRMAAGVSAQRRSAAGLGLTPGQQTAFNTNYGRVVDAPGMLEAVSAAMSDPTKGTLQRVGLSQQDIAGKNTAEVAIAAMGKVQSLVDKTDQRMLGTLLTSGYGIGELGYNLDTLKRMKARPGETAGYAGQYAADAKAMDIPPSSQLAFDNLNVQLNRSRERIEATFVTALAPLAPQFTLLSTDIEGLAEDILRSKGFRDAVTGATTGLHEMVVLLESESFQKEIKGIGTDINEIFTSLFGEQVKINSKSFADDIRDSAIELHKALEWLKHWNEHVAEGAVAASKAVSTAVDVDATTGGSLVAAPAQAIVEWLAKRMGFDPKGDPSKAAPLDKMVELLEAIKNRLPDMSGGLTALPMGYTGSNSFASMIHNATFRTGGGAGSGGGGGGGGPSRGGTPGNVGVTASLIGTPEERALLDAIAGGESRGSYDARNPKGAYGRYQFIPSTRDELLRKMNLPLGTPLTPELQDKMGLMLAMQRGWHAGMSPEESAAKLRGTWVSLPGGSESHMNMEMWRQRLDSAGQAERGRGGSGGGGGGGDGVRTYQSNAGGNQHMALNVRIFNSTGAHVSVQAAALGVG